MPSSISHYVVPLLFVALGCSDAGDDLLMQDMPGATGGEPAVFQPGTGGDGAFGSGGSVATGGGFVGTGGELGATGGYVATGGFVATGGVDASGGFVATGGEPATGGLNSTGGEPATGGMNATGGVPATGGMESTGGADATGGMTATGGTQGGTGGSPPACNEAQANVCSSYKVGTHCGLTYEIWTDSSEACMTNTSTGFKAVWDQGDGNYLARKGVRPGSSAPVVTYSANYQPNGNSYLGVYGWTQNPLIEFYIVDSWGNWRPPGTQKIGDVTADGGTYEIYRSERVNQPSIEGTKTFWQFWSVRTQKRTSGTITVRPHFEAWAAFGLTLGTFYEVSMLVEGYQSSGQADVTVSFK